MIIEPENTRKLTIKEVNKMRRKHLLIIPMILVVGLILWVIVKFETLPEIVRWAGAGIAALAALIFVGKHMKMERDLMKGLVHVVRGEITKRRKFGGRRKRGSAGVARARTSRGGGATFFIYIDGQKFDVPSSIYAKVKEGDQVEMNYFPRSQFYLGIEVIKE